MKGRPSRSVVLFGIFLGRGVLNGSSIMDAHAVGQRACDPKGKDKSQKPSGDASSVLVSVTRPVHIRIYRSSNCFV